MPWVIGIDEAGYGPNLGPLAQAAVAVRLPDLTGDGWDHLAPWVRRAGVKDAGKVLVDDSKLVHSGKYGLLRLEQAVTALLAAPGRAALPTAAIALRPPRPSLTPAPRQSTFAAMLGTLAAPGVVDDLKGEAWFDPDWPLPLYEDCGTDLRPHLRARGLDTLTVGLNLVPTPLFNRIVAGSDSKGVVLAAGLVSLLRLIPERLPADGEPVLILCDKQSGRARYGHLFEAAFPNATLTLVSESFLESRYTITGLNREVTAQIVPDADAAHVAVALASCQAKYAREVCMAQFNRHWQTHLPDLKPTAGYPVDAKRFYDQIAPLLPALGLTPDQVWRCR